jgi:hypothetical protein
MTPIIADPAKIAKVDGVGQGSENSTARRRAEVVRSLSYTSLREATREGERGGGVRRPSGGGGRRPGNEGLMGVVLCSPLLGPPLYIGVEGCTLAPQATRAATKGERRAAVVGVGLAPITLTLAGEGQGPRRPLLPSLDGILSENRH